MTENRKSGALTGVPLNRPKAGIWSWTKKQAARKLFSACRWIHVYMSTALLGLLIFFSITGLLLNHLSWFEHEGDYGETSTPLPPDLLASLREAEEPQLKKLEAYIEQSLGLQQPRKVDIDLEMGELTFDYPLPAGYALVTFIIEEGVMRTEHQEGTVLAVLNDLHKGRHTGGIWSWVIDTSAVLMILMAVSGLVILFQQAKWRLHGLLLVLAGVVLPWLIYLLWVPRLH
ncbi:MAG: PepSY-associated TM helix domain-containing protein [Acidobacteriota bacterium]|nr:PepSY-associated TM helix domain-containing protein [Acidobacteriota bacterium]